MTTENTSPADTKTTAKSIIDKVKDTVKAKPKAKATAKKTAAKKTAAKKAPAKPRSKATAAPKAKASPSKGGKPRVAKKTAAKAVSAALNVRVAYGSEDKKSPYSVFNTHDVFSAYTIACLVVCNMVALSAKGAPTKAKGKAYPGLWRMLVGKRAASYWRKKERVTSEGITAAGLNEIQARLSGNSRGYSTTLETVNAIVAVVTKGGPVTLQKTTYRFTVKAASSN